MSIQQHLVLGRGPIGHHVAVRLVEQGHHVTVASSTGQGVDVPGAHAVSLDAADASAVAALADGAEAIYNCLNPRSYAAWQTLWPPMSDAIDRAAAKSGAVLATASNLYAYGRPTGPMVEGDPDCPVESKGRVRADMWAATKRLHDAGDLRAVEVRASDYVGPLRSTNAHLPRVLPDALQGKPVRVIGSPDQPHTWTDVRDIAATLIVAARTPSAWGRVWHAPSNPPRSQRDAIADMCRAVGVPPARVRSIPGWSLAATGWVMPTMREIRAIDFQFTQPFVMESERTQRELGVQPTAWSDVCSATATASLGT